MKTVFSMMVAFWALSVSALTTNLVQNGAHAGEGSGGSQNVALGTWSFYDGEGTNVVTIGATSGYRTKGAIRSIFIGDGAGRESKDVHGCIAIGPGEMAGVTNVSGVVSIGGRVVSGGGLMYVTPDPLRHTVYAPIFWFNGNHVLTADSQLVLSCPSNVIIKAGHALHLQGVKSCDWTPRMVVEDGALQVYTNGVKAGFIPLSGN